MAETALPGDLFDHGGAVGVGQAGASARLDGFLGFTSADRFLGVRVSALPGLNAVGGGSSYVMTDVSIGTATVPEPGSLALLSLGLAGLGLARRRKA